MGDQTKLIYRHGEVVTQHPVHGGLIPTHGGPSPMHGMNGYLGLGRNLANSGVASGFPSGDVGHGSWGVANGAKSADSAVAPDGTTTADKFTPDATNNFHYVGQGTDVAATVATFSTFAKAAGYPRFGIRTHDGTQNRLEATFDILNGAIVNVAQGYGAFIEAVGNGWFFLGLTDNAPGGHFSGISGWQLESIPAGQLAQSPFLGDGVSGMLLWNPQVVPGTVPGPIIFA